MAESFFCLAGKVVVQCGGSGLLGRSLVTSLSEAGARLVVASGRRAPLQEIASDARTAGRIAESEQVDINLPVDGGYTAK